MNGEKVLVPVLYLAQANNRLGPTGALIAGNDLSLIAGQNLNNVGTLRATNNLSAMAGNDLVNSGLIEAGNRLDLLAGNNIVNKAGGIIAGRDVSLTAVLGDVINERTVTSHQSAAGDATWRRDFADSAARIEAANDLSAQAGRDVKNTGGVLQAGRDVSLSAGRDVNLDSAQTEEGQSRGTNFSTSSTEQLSGTVSAGRDLTAQAGRDINVIASSIDAKRDIAMTATENLTLSSAADELHSYAKSKKVTEQEDHVSQVSAELNAGGSVALKAGQDLAMIASRISAGDSAYLVAGERLGLLSAEDSDYSLYDMKKKGSFGSKKTQRDEVTQVTNVGSEIITGGDLTLESGSDQVYQAAKLNSGDDLTIDSGGDITFESVKDLHQESHEKSKSNAGWFSMKGKGSTDETVRQTEMVAQGELVINAVGNIKADVLQVNQQTVHESIEAMVKADPKLEWLKQLEAQGGVDWRQVQEIHTSFKYSNSGLGPAAKIIIAIMMAAVLGPAGLGLTGAPLAGAASLATTATVSTINNKGNLGVALKETLSKDSLKNAATAMATAGALQYADQTWFNAGDAANNGAVQASNGQIVPATSTPNNVLTWSNASDVALRATGRAVISGSISTAINGGSLGENFLGALSGEGATVAMATGFKWVGDQTIRFDDGSAEKIFAHAIVGGLIAEATGGDFKTGAAAAGLNEALINGLNEAAQGNEQIHMMLSQLTGLVAAVAVGGDLQQGVSIAQAATEYNHNLHLNNAKAAAKAIMQACQSRADLCTGDVSRVTEQDLVYALEVSARHGEGADQLNWDAALLVDQFRALAKQLDDKGLEDDLFTPTESEAHRIAIGDTVEAVGAIASVANAIRLFAKNPSGIVEAVKGLFGGAKGIDKLFEAGRTPKASELKQFAESQGWKPSQTDGGPLKYVDENGIPRVTIKQGSSRAPGSADPHVEFKNAAGQRTDAFGNPVTRKSPDNHTSIDFDL